MIYFDTDVWIHSFIRQDKGKHTQSRSIINEYTQKGYIISNLNIQEILFVLVKLKINHSELMKIAEKLLQLNIEYYFYKEIERAILLAKRVGFRHINDCIHTAIAESFCDEIITYNKKDFSKIQSLTKIKVRIL